MSINNDDLKSQPQIKSDLQQLFEDKDVLINKLKVDLNKMKMSTAQLIDLCAQQICLIGEKDALIDKLQDTIKLDEGCRKKLAELVLALHNSNCIVEQQQRKLDEVTGSSYVTEPSTANNYLEKYLNLSSETEKSKLDALEISKQYVNASIEHTAKTTKSVIAKHSRQIQLDNDPLQIVKKEIQDNWIKKIKNGPINQGDVRNFYDEMIKAYPLLQENIATGKLEIAYNVFSGWLTKAETEAGVCRKKVKASKK